MRIEKQLPPEIADYYENEPIHKAVKNSASLIVVHTKSHRRDQWRKHGKRWELQPVGKLPRPKLGKAPLHLFGVPLPETYRVSSEHPNESNRGQ